MKRIEVLFSPAEFAALTNRDLSGVTCVVFDILRATTTLMTALQNGAAAVIPVETIQEAVALRAANPSLLLAGERDGFRITSKLTGSVDFDFGNSPGEFIPEKVQNRTIVMTTTNGTRGLKACRGAAEVIAGSFLNLSAIVEHVWNAGELLLVCSGTHEEASVEDTLAAGALADSLWTKFEAGHIADSAQIARVLYHAHANDLAAGMRLARNGRRLLSLPELRDDVAFCLQRDVIDFVARLESDGAVRRITAARYK